MQQRVRIYRTIDKHEDPSAVLRGHNTHAFPYLKYCLPERTTTFANRLFHYPLFGRARNVLIYGAGAVGLGLTFSRSESREVER